MGFLNTRSALTSSLMPFVSIIYIRLKGLLIIFPLILQNSSTPNCHQAVLFLTRVTNTDVGEYSFIVRSPNGLSEGVFIVNMTYASGYIVKSACGSLSATFYVNVVVLLILTCCY